ncbi:MAG: peptide chain release factor N(5)-glutamine methyltransferase [Treponema lecithinolyticum]|uniref:peptide chain release factor N(5)-glutamine methyltransferase n=1 Tax=Treponema lecithinolyticum TaxID=53418 RepID=UPI00360BCB81
MTVRQARKKALSIFQNLLDPVFTSSFMFTPALDADCLLAHVLGKDRSFLLAHDEIELSAAQERAFFNAVSRRNAGLPVAYITGTKEFFGFDFKVTQDVLIPKPDTELLVERTLCELEYLAAQRRSKTDIAIGTASGSATIDTGAGKDSALYAADVCTGSGCVALSALASLQAANTNVVLPLSDFAPPVFFTASDISKKALKIARINAHNLLLPQKAHSIRFVRADLLDFPHPPFDLIVSNPPYVPSAAAAQLLQDGRSEPHLALDGGRDGLDLIRRLVVQAFAALKSGGVLLLETGEYNARQTAELMTKAGFTDIVTYNDLSGMPRVTRGCKRDNDDERFSAYRARARAIVYAKTGDLGKCCLLRTFKKFFSNLSALCRRGKR